MIRAVTRAGVSIALAAAATVAPTAVNAQSTRVADSLLAAGNVARAESAYYALVSVRPRDPVARWALGRFLVARGATRVGATLLEESLQFGGDPVLVGRELVDVYLRMNDFAPLSALTAASPAQRDRARWLTTHEPRVVAPDSVFTLPLSPAADASELGRISIRVNGVPLLAAIVSNVRGIVVARSAVAGHRLKLFTAGGDSTQDVDMLGVADSIGFARLSMTNQPMTVSGLAAGMQAMIGLTDLGRFAPSADPSAGTLTLHVGGAVRRDMNGERLPTLDQPTGLAVLSSDGWITAPGNVARLLQGRAWTFDARGGTLIVAR